jgi:hypothetical protein
VTNKHFQKRQQAFNFFSLLESATYKMLVICVFRSKCMWQMLVIYNSHFTRISHAFLRNGVAYTLSRSITYKMLVTCISKTGATHIDGRNARDGARFISAPSCGPMGLTARRTIGYKTATTTLPAENLSPTCPRKTRQTKIWRVSLCALTEKQSLKGTERRFRKKTNARHNGFADGRSDHRA